MDPVENTSDVSSSADSVEPSAAPNVEASAVETPDEKKPFKAIDSQEALDRIISERLARDRKARGVDKLEGLDIDELLAAKQRVDEIEAEKKAAELEKLDDIEKRDLTIQEQAAELESLRKQVAEFQSEKLRSEVAAAKGVPLHLASRLRGETKEELEADADELMAALKPAQVPSERPEPVGGGNPATADEAGFDASALAEKLRGRF